MNGTDLDRQLDTVRGLEELEYTEPQAFCQIALKNVGCMSYYDATYNYQADIELLRNKIKENIYDDQTIHSAKIILERVEFTFLRKLHEKKKNYNRFVKRQISKYRRSSNALKMTQKMLQLFVIIGATIVPFILNIPDSPRVISTYISGIVAVSATILNFYKFSEHAVHSYQAAESMQTEYNQYLTNRGIYKKLEPGAALDLFMDQIDLLRQEQNELSLSLEKISQDQDKDQIQKIEKSLKGISPQSHTENIQ